MNESENKLLKRLLEKVRAVYQQKTFVEAYDSASGSYSTYLNLKGMVNNKNFSRIAENEINKAFKYANDLHVRNKK